MARRGMGLGQAETRNQGPHVSLFNEWQENGGETEWNSSLTQGGGLSSGSLT